MCLDVIQRYKPVLDYLSSCEPVHNRSVILEVGTGAAGISQFTDAYRIINCDLSFEGKRTASALYVAAGAACLPFKDGTVDYVLSIDMLEHIEKSQRPTVIDELLRVSRKGMIIGFPCNARNHFYEKAFADVYESFGLTHQSLREHFQIEMPKYAEIYGCIKERLPKGSIQSFNNVNVRIYFISQFISTGMYAIMKVFRVKSKCFMKLFGWTARFVNFGDCYRKILYVDKTKGEQCL